MMFSFTSNKEKLDSTDKISVMTSTSILLNPFLLLVLKHFPRVFPNKNLKGFVKFYLKILTQLFSKISF